MNINELNKRDDLMVDSDELKERIDSYFENISKEELKKDLEDVGCKVEKVNAPEIENYLLEAMNYISSKSDEEMYAISDVRKYFSEEKDVWELAAAWKTKAF